ncbi:beta-1,4-galactosyltransferase 1-like [Polyodon spathula]|uniref:beta-1,4-galactosyltransferase 1-like n=1 Tax=Polyodon spathula TaxID=7913 RepID=UPI001B7E2FFB|nr:beta-1,4-galactosyltransferase 1-like [Polyodon spathula]
MPDTSPAVVNIPGSFLQKTCTVVVVFCAIHLSVTVLYYCNTFEIFKNSFFVRNQQQQKHIDFNTVSPITETNAPFTEAEETKPKELEKCPETSPLLVGPLRIEFSQPVDLEESKNPALQEGGRFTPQNCKALQKVAVIIPFRNREEHLKYWLYYLHPILQRQQLDYGVYVIHQKGEETFNRAKLLNVGYAEALKEYDYDCFVFSDVDLIPMDDRNIYKCFSQPRHIAVSMDKFGFSLPYKQFFGGISSLSKEQFEKINGFPNNYWGWGGEDDDIYNRIVSKGMGISRPDGTIGKCRMIRHNRDKKNEPNPQRFDRITHTMTDNEWRWHKFPVLQGG